VIRKLGLSTAALGVAVLVFLVATLPPAPQRVSAGDPALAARTIPGAFHIHTTRSDGAADKPMVARAAARAGLRFAVFTDHGDGTRSPDPPEYIEGVLCLDGVEISTKGGHYVAVGMRPAPYPLGGEARAVVEDVARLGGFGVAAHPGSRRAELAWADWSLGFDGIEWLNADSEWRDERRWRLARTLFDYLLRPAAALAALLDRPEETLSRWDGAGAQRRIVTIAAHDAHGGIGGRQDEGESGRVLHVPSYESSFGAFSVRAILDRPFSGDAAADAAALLDALRAGHSFTSIDAVAPGTTLEFRARTTSGTAMQGDRLPGPGPVTFIVRAAVPEGAETQLLRNGEPIAQRIGGSLELEASGEGTYRVEVRVPGAPGTPPVPWLLSNPIFRHAEPPVDHDAPAFAAQPLSLSGWRLEKDPASTGRVVASATGAAMEYALRAGARASQFAALAVDLPADMPGYSGVAFTAHASAPTRVSVQFRFARDGEQRWGRSVYLDREPRDVTVTDQELAAADSSTTRPDLRRATSLLFVVDLTNAAPGARGQLHVSHLRLLR
jgi:hypothetical protein